jgi:ABC-type uncharacterized transport system substrate-binding protein
MSFELSASSDYLVRSFRSFNSSHGVRTNSLCSSGRLGAPRTGTSHGTSRNSRRGGLYSLSAARSYCLQCSITDAARVQIEERFAGSDLEALRAAAEQLVKLNVDVISAGGTSAALAAQQATQRIPIVGVSMADPVADGLVGSLARPGGNVTGNTFIGPELGTKRHQLLKEAVPAAVRFAGLQQPKAYGERTMQYMVSELEEKARSAQTDFRVFNASHPDEFDSALEAMVAWRAEALVTFPSAMFYANFRRIVDLASKHSIPTICVFKGSCAGWRAHVLRGRYCRSFEAWR